MSSRPSRGPGREKRRDQRVFFHQRALAGARSVPIVFFVPIQGFDFVHFLLSQLKMVELGIFPDVIWVRSEEHTSELQSH